MRQIALLGVGTMGSGMAENWLKKGFSLAVYNRTKSKADALAAKGARVANTPQEATVGAELIPGHGRRRTCIARCLARREWRPRGSRAGSHSRRIPHRSARVGTRARASRRRARCEFLDVPVAGSKTAAASGGLTLFVGGDPVTLERARPALDAIGRQIVHLGSTGAGATWKLIHNMMLAVHVAAASEAIALAAKAGFDPAQTAGLIANGPAGSGIVQMKLPRFTERRFDEADFALRHMLKDSRYALALGEKFGLRLNLVRAAAAVYERADQMGFGDHDFSGVINAVTD